MRIHVDIKSVLVALGRAVALHRAGVAVTDVAMYDAGKPAARKKEKRSPTEQELDDAVAAARSAYMTCPDWAVLVAALQRGAASEVGLTTFVPVVPMLGKPCKSLREIVVAMRGQPFVADYKYDGQRAQIHLSAGEVRVYSRHRKNATDKFASIHSCVATAAVNGVESFILDAEIVAVDRRGEVARVLPFQTLQTIKTGSKSGVAGSVSGGAAMLKENGVSADGAEGADGESFPSDLQLCVM